MKNNIICSKVIFLNNKDYQGPIHLKLILDALNNEAMMVALIILKSPNRLKYYLNNLIEDLSHGSRDKHNARKRGMDFHSDQK